LSVLIEESESNNISYRTRQSDWSLESWKTYNPATWKWNYTRPTNKKEIHVAWRSENIL